MKVYFDARMIDHPGIGRYIRCLVPLLAEDKSIELHLLGSRGKIERITNYKFQIIDFEYPIYSIREQMGFLRLRKIIGNDILHVPHYNVPILAKFKLVSTVHDLIHITYPAGASGRLAPLYMKFMLKRILNTAKAVICVSEATKNEIVRLLEKKDRLHVIYEGVDKVFEKITDSAYLNSLKEKYKLPEKFILYVGSIRRHKNIDGLLNAYAEFRKSHPEFSLVMIGRYGQDIDIKREGVLYLGELASDRELAAIYNLASCLLNLSLYEGFGLTILEAQACGLPVLCSNIPVHREIGGDGISTVTPSYIDRICENMYNILFNNETRRALILKGFRNVERFDWAVTAEKTLDLYRKLDNEGSDSSRLAPGDAGRRENP